MLLFTFRSITRTKHSGDTKIQVLRSSYRLRLSHRIYTGIVVVKVTKNVKNQKVLALGTTNIRKMIFKENLQITLGEMHLLLQEKSLLNF